MAAACFNYSHQMRYVPCLLRPRQPAINIVQSRCCIGSRLSRVSVCLPVQGNNSTEIDLFGRHMKRKEMNTFW